MPNFRSLTEGERARLSTGLVKALDDAGAQPVISDMAHPAALVSRLWRGYVPILTLGQVIHWPQAIEDYSHSAEDMAVLQHELHHVFEFATGVLTPLSYLIHPRNWTYKVEVDDACQWCDLGAEQRAVLAERLWWGEQRAALAECSRIAELVPWATADRA